MAQFYQAAVDLSARQARVTVCCERVQYMDAAGIQVLLALGRELVSRGGKCDITGVAGQLLNDFRLLGLQ